MALRLLFDYTKFKRAFPAVAFFGGFLFDAFTLGQGIQTYDLFILLGYLILSGGILLWMGRRGITHHGSKSKPHDDFPPGGTSPGAVPHGDTLPGVVRPGVTPSGAASSATASGVHAASSEFSGVLSPAQALEAPSTKFGKLRHWLREDGPFFALQFFFGGMFSALVIFYFLSSSYLPSFAFILLLVALLCLNEFLEDHYHHFTLTWTFFGLCAILFLNFALPHLFHSIHPVWFYLSTALGTASVFGLKRLSRKARGSAWPAVVMAGLLTVLYICNAIPPVPLVKKSLIICRDLEKQGSDFYARIEEPPFWFFWRASENEVRQRPGEKIYCYTSIFLPTGIQCTLYHRWMHDDGGKKGWTEYSRIGFPIHGGRKDGFRGFTFKRTLAPGDWRVRVETESGRVLGTIGFRAESTSDTAMTYKELRLD